MGIYIHGLKMPGRGCIKTLIILDGGHVIETTYGCSPQPGKQNYTAVPVPPHGRLGDLDELSKQIDIARNYGVLGKTAHYKLQKLVKEAPTIIEAEEGET